MSVPANLQLTVKQVAELMNVSERTIYNAKRLLRHNRPDLVARVEAGTMSVSAALRIVEGKAKPTSWDRLVRTWNSATDDDRGRLWLRLAHELEKAGS
jgi:hypothetical protein